MPNPIVIPAGFAECTFVIQQVNLNRKMTFGIGASVAVSEASLGTNLGDWFRSTALGGFASLLDNHYAATDVEVIGHTFTATDSGFQLGNQGPADYLPPAVAVKIRKVTDVRGRAHKGSMFWPGYAKADQVDNEGNISSTWFDDIEVVADALQTAIGVDGSLPYVLHHALSSDTTPTLIDDLVPLASVHTQRRRQTPR